MIDKEKLSNKQKELTQKLCKGIEEDFTRGYVTGQINMLIELQREL